MRHYRRLIARRAAALGLVCVLLQGCGFVTAPIGQASVELMSVSLRSADNSVERGGQAAAYVGETVSSGTQWTVESLQELRQYLLIQHAKAIQEQKARRLE